MLSCYNVNIIRLLIVLLCVPGQPEAPGKARWYSLETFRAFLQIFDGYRVFDSLIKTSWPKRYKPRFPLNKVCAGSRCPLEGSRGQPRGKRRVSNLLDVRRIVKALIALKYLCISGNVSIEP